MSEDQLDLPLWQRLGENNISDAALFREFGDIPSLVRVVRRPPIREQPERSYEEAKWAHLSPAFRAAHNRLRRMRGQSPIPEPALDLYVPRPPAIRRFDPGDPEVRAAARAFVGPTLMGVRGGFTINGQAVNDGMIPLRSRETRTRETPPQAGEGREGDAGQGEDLFPGARFPSGRGGEGFTINGARVGGRVIR